MHTGGHDGWVEGAFSSWVVEKKKKKEDYHNNVDHAKFIEWFHCLHPSSCNTIYLQDG
jgi:hypothetical protein